MVDQPGPDSKDNAQETIFNSDIGDDWGEAFAAEDFMASPQEEANQEFFLPDDIAEITLPSPTVNAGAPEPPQDSAPSRPPLLHSLAARIRQTPIPLRLALIGIPIAGLLLFLTLRRSPEAPTLKPEVQPKSAAVHPSEEPVAHLPAPPTVAHPAAPAPEGRVPARVPPEPQMVRKKWRFPAIIVPTKADNGQPPPILTADLTLTLKLAPEVIPPANQDTFIREILYQFYTNQPPDDLKRYALDRGEMNRKLKAWIIKQWPKLPLESITTDRYELL